MNLRNLCNRIASLMLALCAVGSIVGLGTPSVLAQPITVTTPFPFCVNNQGYPKGSYELTHLSQWVLAIRNVNGGYQSLFMVRPEDRMSKGATIRSGLPFGSLTFRTSQGIRELQAIHEPDSSMTLALAGQRITNDKLRTDGPPKQTSCFTDGSSIRGQDITGK
jgi:hypothetical protein